ncbi:MAG: SagB/ThcOx family dehydrogenase [Desulfurococcaceae archaeon]
MKNIHIVISVICALLVLIYVFSIDIDAWFYYKRTTIAPDTTEYAGFLSTDKEIFLPLPRSLSNMTVEEAILLRRSIREYTEDPVKLEHLALILWSAYGVTETRYGLRAVPSAGGTYPLEVYVVIGSKGVIVSSEIYVKPGIYKYDFRRHSLVLLKEGDYRKELARAALDQPWVEKAPVSIVVFAIYERTTRIYGERGYLRYVPMEVGHLGQNVYLMATALGYGTVVVGAFHDDQVKSIIGVEVNEVPMYIIPIGVPKERSVYDFNDIWNYIEANR